jgi:hypothetical protein
MHGNIVGATQTARANNDSYQDASLLDEAPKKGTNFVRE